MDNLLETFTEQFNTNRCFVSERRYVLRIFLKEDNKSNMVKRTE